MRRRLSATCAIILSICLAGALAQQGQQPVFRGVTRVIPVTVTVLDQQGKPVAGLTQSDFKVFENDQQRPIANFFPQVLTPGPVVEPGTGLAAQGRPGLAPATRRTFMLVLGAGQIQKPTNALDGAMKFVREHLLPQDAVAVMAFHRTTALTTNHAAIEEVLSRYKREHIRLMDDLFVFMRASRARGVCGGPSFPDAYLANIDQALFEGVIPPQSLRTSLDLLLGMDQAPATAERRYQKQLTFDQLLKDLEHACMNLSDAMVTSGRLRLMAAIEALRHADGEKHVVYMGSSMTPPRGQELLVARANDARVTVNFISTLGMIAPRGGSRALSGCYPCRDVVEKTGGFYTSVDMMDKALAKVDENSRVSYLIGYTPADSALDGTYREIRIEVSRPRTSVAYRHGYFASDAPAGLTAADLMETVRADAAARYDVDTKDIKVTVTATPAAPAKPGSPISLSVKINVDLETVSLLPVNGVRTGQLDVSVYCGDSNEKVVGETKVRWNLRADGLTYDEWMKSGLTRTITLEAATKPKYVKVVVYDRESDRVGSSTITLR